MSAFDSLPDSVKDVFGEQATAEQAYDLLTVDVPPAAWITALTTARDELGCTFFDWLSAVDEPGTGFRVCAHVVALAAGHPPRRLLLRTTVPHEAPALPTAIGVYAGAGWHERETHEMFGVDFTGHPHLVPLLLPENFEGHPLRKDFVLAARVAKAWPGAKEPGESHDGGGPKRRQMLPPGVPDPNEWGPLKGQLPPAPTRPARAAAGRARATTEGPEAGAPARRSRSVTEGSASRPDPSTPARRSRSVSEGSASQAAPEPGAPVRRSRSVSEGSASQAAPEPGAPVRRSRTTAEGSASQAAPEPGAPVRRSRTTADGSASQAAPGTATPAAPRTRSSDAPWHHARPAFDEKPEQPEAPAEAAPTAPAEPKTAATPTGPEAPAAPVADDPAVPAEAGAPAQPDGPATGATPAEPAAPAERATDPATPAEPDAPATPVAPGPAAGAAPATRPAPAEGPPPAAAEPEGGPPAGRRDAAETTETTDPAGGDPA
ncbi:MULTISPECIES: NADH-quinone oxidoreductase subunit C [Streptomyces]|uniref:Dehydrogenase n=1 Tax=Streptomyces venezuelae TaxID=54571 RepID=A0A5P2ASE6_STRVZ|nr:NADH-quinone oxidoreductase subunit C [Streptomyces venezuelae]QES20478.1 dehydrogenase [Streptomyces venezuelae]